MEVRASWQIKSGETKFKNKNIKNVKSLVLPVSITNLDFEQIQEGKIPLGARIYKSNGEETEEYVLGKPFEFFTPVVHKKDYDKWMIGFLHPDFEKEMKNGHFNNCDIGIVVSDSGYMIFCNVYLEKVKSLEFIQLEK